MGIFLSSNGFQILELNSKYLIHVMDILFIFSNCIYLKEKKKLRECKNDRFLIHLFPFHIPITARVE